MSDKTGISWTDSTWNPIRGCMVVSPGCTNCYAMEVAARFSGPGLAYEGLARRTKDGKAVWTGKLMLVESHLNDPIRWQRPRRIFVNSMSDVFFEQVPDSYIDRMFHVMESTPRHTFQILTKRPDRMRDYVTDRATRFRAWNGAIKAEFGLEAPGTTWAAAFPHIWLGTSVERQQEADQRIPVLLDTPAAVRFLSCEPLLGPLDLGSWIDFGDCAACNGLGDFDGVVCPECGGSSWKMSAPIHWVIVGGESGPGYRPMDPEWALDLRDQCRAADVPFFFKQSSGPRTEMGRELDGQRWEQWPA